MNAYFMVITAAINKPFASTNQEVLAAYATQDSLEMAPPVRVRNLILNSLALPKCSFCDTYMGKN